jgi:hypothetical protein
LRGAPPVPPDDLTSLRVSYFLVANKSVNADTVTDLTQSLVDVRRDLLSQYPILAQAGAPSTDADALIPIHPGAATYHSGNQQSFLDKYDDKPYYESVLLGSLISIIIAAWRFAGSGIASQSMLEPLYELGDKIKHAKRSRAGRNREADRRYAEDRACQKRERRGRRRRYGRPQSRSPQAAISDAPSPNPASWWSAGAQAV